MGNVWFIATNNTILICKRAFADLRIISNIAQLGVIMISDNFVIHCESIVLRVGGSWVKERLHVAFSWIKEHSKVFRFERAHRKIQSRSLFEYRIN